MQNAPHSMRYADFQGDDVIALAEKDRPEPVPGEALVRITRTALCGSDFKLWHKGAAHVAGHEICGIVRQDGYFHEQIE